MTRQIVFGMCGVGAALLLLPSPLRAQGSYPGFQPPRTVNREYNFALADVGNQGTSLLFQWREGAGARSQLSLDVGIVSFSGNRYAVGANAPGSRTQFLVGGQVASQLANESADVPLSFLLTAGASMALGKYSVLRLPVGVSTGHRFELDKGMALTPYAHPRLAFAYCSSCNKSSDFGVNFDVGANFEFSTILALRATAMFGGSDYFSDDGFGLSLAWTPPGLRRRE